jgi:DnaA family protein
MKQIPLAIGVEREPVFETFLSDLNEAALAHLSAVVAPDAPLYLWGPPGCGKSHLLQALARRWRGRGFESCAFDANTPLPWVVSEACALVLIDEVDRLDAAQQHAAFGLFVEAAARGAQMACAGRLPPVDLSVRDDLRTRLGWGLVYALRPLPEAAVRRALVGAASHNGLLLVDEVLDFLLARFQRDLGSLMGLLGRLDRYALAQCRPITIPLLKQMLAEENTAP